MKEQDFFYFREGFYFAKYIKIMVLCEFVWKSNKKMIYF